MDLNYITNNNKKTDIMVIFTNLNDRKISIEKGDFEHSISISKL